MKTMGFVLLTLGLLTSPSLAAEYQGQSIDGRQMPAKVYSYATGAVYAAQVQFDRDQATIIFSGGGQLRLKLKQPNITNLDRIEGYGSLGQVPLGRSFSIGLNQGGSNNDLISGKPHPLQDFWSIQLDSTNPPTSVQR